MDLSNLSIPELQRLLDQIPREIERRKKEEKNKLLKELEAKAAERGFSLSDLIGETPAKKERAPVAAKYRHPSNPELTWSGRGRQPRWVAEFVQNGGQMAQLEI